MGSATDHAGGAYSVFPELLAGGERLTGPFPRTPPPLLTHGAAYDLDLY